MEKDNQRVAITKRLLKEGLLRLLRQKELDKINVTELCRESDINRATFYRHYQSPHDILAEIERDLFYQIKNQFPMPTCYQEIEPCMIGIFTFLYDRADLLRILIQCNTDMDLTRLINDLYLEIWSELADANRTGIPQLDPESIKLLVSYCSGGGYCLLRQWLLEDIQKTPQEIANLCCGLLQHTEWILSKSQYAANLICSER